MSLKYIFKKNRHYHMLTLIITTIRLVNFGYSKESFDSITKEFPGSRDLGTRQFLSKILCK